LLAVLGEFEPCLIASRLMQQRIIRLVNFKRLALKSGLCHRLT
jgi:hypothetical protein